jgi:hypothetical protein
MLVGLRTASLRRELRVIAALGAVENSAKNKRSKIGLRFLEDWGECFLTVGGRRLTTHKNTRRE